MNSSLWGFLREMMTWMRRVLRDLYDNPDVMMNCSLKSHIIMHHMHDFMERTGVNFSKTNAEAIECSHQRLRDLEKIHNSKTKVNLGIEAYATSTQVPWMPRNYKVSEPLAFNEPLKGLKIAFHALRESLRAFKNTQE